MNKTPAEARKLWVEALRSGRYEQGTGWLCRNGQYCCLGVACEVYNEHEPEKLKVMNGRNLREFDGNAAVTPDKIVAWLGLTAQFGKTKEGFDLSALNDGRNYTFQQIADVIEKGELLYA